MKKRISVPINKLPPVIANAVAYINQAIPMPTEIALSAVLACQATVNQGIFRIRDTRGGEQPLSIHIYTIADSGEGKSPAVDIASAPIKKFEQEFKQPRKSGRARTNAQDQITDQMIRSLTREMGRLAAKGKDFSRLETELENHLADCEKGDYRPNFFFNDSSSAKLIANLANGFPFVTQLSDEGIINLVSGAFENSGLVIKMWDNGNYQFDRVNKSFDIDGALSIFTAPQRAIFWKWMKSDAGQQAVAMGKLARGLVTFPESIQGERDFCKQVPDDALIQPYYDALRHNLELYRDGIPVRQTLELTPEARAYARWYQQAIERQLREGGFFCEMRPPANKSALNALRLAGNFHLAERNTGPVTGETMRCAIFLAAFFLWEYRCGVAPETKLERNARLLNEFLQKQDDGSRPFHVARRDILRGADPAIRHVESLDPAAAYLQQLGVATIAAGARGSWSIGLKEKSPSVPTPVKPSLGDIWQPPMSVGRVWAKIPEAETEDQEFLDGMIWPGILMPEF